MRTARLILMCFAAAGLLALALPLGQEAQAGGAPCAMASHDETAAGCPALADASPTACETPCLCLPALPGVAPEPEARKADRFAAPAVRPLPDLAHWPDPLPPKPPAA